MAIERVDESLVDEGLLRYAIIPSRYAGKWLFCKHEDRDTWELPAGTKEPGERIEDTARRELYEETGALEYELHPIGYYTIAMEGQQLFSYLCFADIAKLGPLPPMEIELIELFDHIPHPLTYPDIQPVLFAEAQKFLASLG